MARFIELHRNMRNQEGDVMALPVLVNLDHVDHVKDSGKTCTVAISCGMASEVIKPVETYEQVRRLVGAATGGIPIAELDEMIRGMD